MVYKVKGNEKVNKLFEGWEETLIYSCTQNVMGELFVDDIDCPKSANAYIGAFAFLAGEPNAELLGCINNGLSILVPQNEDWESIIENAGFKALKKYNRYAIKKNTIFNIPKLEAFAKALPEGYEIKKIDGALYDRCRKAMLTEDFVSIFDSKEHFLEMGLGFVVLKGDEIVGGASSYSRYNGGIEIETDVKKEERQKGLATACGATLILECLKRGLYPSWDAQTMISVKLAEKLGYEYDHEYTAYVIIKE